MPDLNLLNLCNMRDLWMFPSSVLVFRLHDYQVNVWQFTHQDFVHRQTDPVQSSRLWPA